MISPAKQALGTEQMRIETELLRKGEGEEWGLVE